MHFFYVFFRFARVRNEVFKNTHDQHFFGIYVIVICYENEVCKNTADQQLSPCAHRTFVSSYKAIEFRVFFFAFAACGVPSVWK